jgi:hypothetical protein
VLLAFFIILLVFLLLSCEGVGFPMGYPRTVYNLEVESGEELGPPGLPVVEEPISSEVCEVPMIRDHFDTMVGPLQQWSPFLERRDYGQEFLVIDLVVALGWGVLFGVEGDGVEDVVIIILG